MAQTPREKAGTASGEPAAVVRAVVAAKAPPVSVVQSIASGDLEALANTVAIPGIIKRAIKNDDVQNLPANLQGLI